MASVGSRIIYCPRGHRHVVDDVDIAILTCQYCKALFMNVRPKKMKRSGES